MSLNSRRESNKEEEKKFQVYNLGFWVQVQGVELRVYGLDFGIEGLPLRSPKRSGSEECNLRILVCLAIYDSG